MKFGGGIQQQQLGIKFQDETGFYNERVIKNIKNK